MGKKKLIKKMVLTADFRGLTEADKLKKEAGMAKAQIDNPGYVAGLTPTAASVQAKITAIDDPIAGLIVKRLAADATSAALTVQINSELEVIENIIVDQWMPQTQTALGSDEIKAKTLQFGIKGQKTAPVIDTSSNPIIMNIDINVHDKHTLKVRDSHTKKSKLRADVLRIDIYGVTSDTAPADLADLIAKGGGYLGQVSRGKYVHDYVINPLIKQTEQYIAVYIGKATKKPIAQSPVQNAPMN